MEMRILAISGSLRARSSNTTLLQTMALLAPDGVGVEVYRGLGELPLFNLDDDLEPGAPPVRELRAVVRRCDALLLSTPEYAHGLPGALKNGLDWLVGSGEVSGKRCVLVHASSRGVFAQESLREVLRTMDARLVSEAERTIELAGRHETPEALCTDAAVAEALRSSFAALLRCTQAS